ncbi:MAG: metallophosphoesterase family protein [Oscillatoria sp. PMC 1051.18]|uniref:metallophosphoesterase family protein n=1 Tax=Oscillatoria salina TaxID=331517 RepID=UPI0013BC363A|nr:metallophosphoesterase family protein [Oscillatoria salina]MBZ8181414.1 serine/threonine protein phosphatase [Oscillatoria salina IIICB1]MEC4893426.1 metallophosphoesterase family protein [Oscillatoria sp. PMC 1050.18]MEC5030204.1 metallophosphoesterase family protein [Oscillatoria sp. PMC 1051.18]NET88720.1 serine/threonine protein phosphatase [Kamptonema sp. SIO1D9]
MTDRKIFIGDVHGHYDALMSLLEAIAPGKNDRVYFLGDLIDRGPKSAQVVSFVIENKYQCLLGNHEEMLLLAKEDPSNATLQAWLYSGGNSTMKSYGQRGIPEEHIEWMKNLPIYLDLGDVWLVHAGVNPNLPLEKQTSDQFCWIRDEFHSSKKPYFPDKLIITGHTITFTLPGVIPGKLAQGEGWLDIDTGAYHQTSGWLTGLDYTNGVVYQINVKQLRSRKMPLSEAITKVKPQKILPRRLLLGL